MGERKKIGEGKRELNKRSFAGWSFEINYFIFLAIFTEVFYSKIKEMGV